MCAPDYIQAYECMHRRKEAHVKNPGTTPPIRVFSREGSRDDNGCVPAVLEVSCEDAAWYDGEGFAVLPRHLHNRVRRLKSDIQDAHAQVRRPV